MNMPASGFFAEGDRATMAPANPTIESSRIETENVLNVALQLTLLKLQQSHGNGQTAEAIQAAAEYEAYLNAADDKKLKSGSQNMTECVPVPSSEHVAEIVGRQGCKIKALRAKTNTYIKTPVRGEEPVFVVTGRSEDVANAKIEIMSAADHFSQIRACRKNNTNGSMAPGPPNVPGQITFEVRVPYRVVGLVVGPKGATIKRIQQVTQTYIVTPSREKDPIFEVTGMPENVYLAKKEIEAHIAMRTGNGTENPGYPGYDEGVGALAICNGRNETNLADGLINSSEFLNNLCKYNGDGSSNSLNGLAATSISGMPTNNGINGSSLHYGNGINGMNSSVGNGLNSISGMGAIGSNHGMNRLPPMNGFSTDLGNFSNSENSLLYSNNLRRTVDATCVLPPIGCGLTNKPSGLNMNNGFSYSHSPEHNGDHCNGDSYNIWSEAGNDRSMVASLLPHGRIFNSTVGSVLKTSFVSAGNSATVSPDFEIHAPAMRSSSDPNCIRTPLAGYSHLFDTSPSPPSTPHSSSPDIATVEDRAESSQICIVCKNSNAIAALIPCGHNLFCVDCAKLMVAEKTKCKSPVCDQIPTHSIRILRSNQV